MSIEFLERKDVDEKYTWDLSSIFKTEEEFEESLEKFISLSNGIEKDFKGKLKDAKSINACLDKLKDILEAGSLLGTYAYLALAVNQMDTESQSRQARISNIMSDINSRLSFIESEIIQLDEEIIKEAIEESRENAKYLEDILRRKPHALHPEAEKTLAALSNVLGAAYEIYNRAKLADMDFGTFTVDGKEYPLSFVLFEGKWEYERDTKTRIYLIQGPPSTV